MSQHQVETSVFMQQQQDRQTQPTTVVSSRPLLSSTNSTAKRTTSQTLRRSIVASRWKLVGVLVIIFLLIAIITILTLLLLPKRKSTADETSSNQLAQSIDSSSSLHLRCPSNGDIGSGDSPMQWRAYPSITATWNESSSIWEEIQQSTSGELPKYPFVVISPTFTMNNNSCSVQVSFDFQSESSFHVFLVTSSEVRELNVTSESCHYAFVDDAVLLSNVSSFQILIFSPSSIEIRGSNASVTSQKCAEFENIATGEISSGVGTFARVKSGSRNLCSSEIYNKTLIECDWLYVTSLGSGHFTRQEEHDCVARGVSYFEGDGLSWFLALTGTQPDTRGYLVSPVMESGTSHLMLSLWYIAQCNGTHLRVYLVPSYRDIGAVTSELTPVLVISDVKPSQKWIFFRTTIPVPAEYMNFQVVIEGVVTSQGSCERHKCHLDQNASPKDAEVPLLALDELALEMKYDQCQPSDVNRTTIDCEFQMNANTSTVCKWRSSLPEWAKLLDSDYFNEFYYWMPGNQGDDEEVFHGATTDHLKDRGFILNFDATGHTGISPHFRSPLLVAGSRCSCAMSFLYLLRGEWAPRLNVNLVLGADTDDQFRPLKPQFSVIGHQSDDWMVARLPLNLQPGIPFQVEIRLSDIEESRADVNIDDIFFHDCDFHLYDEE
ncbi:unnamed protein product [Clavelina lepadiformis]|uniref:MAM domain-containing protein n=1 Tax=Clavelina lepadiformis TaxID=159417 RepID=A0ABP0GAG4_CLALP